MAHVGHFPIAEIKHLTQLKGEKEMYFGSQLQSVVRWLQPETSWQKGPMGRSLSCQEVQRKGKGQGQDGAFKGAPQWSASSHRALPADSPFSPELTSLLPARRLSSSRSNHLSRPHF